MHFAIIIQNLSGGGAEKSVLMLAQALHRAGHHAEVWTLFPKREYELPPEVPVFLVNHIKLWKLARDYKHFAAWSLRRFAHKRERDLGHKFDLIISNMRKSDDAVRRSGIGPAVHVLRNSLIGQLSLWENEFPDRRAKKKHHEILSNALAHNGRHVSGVSRGLIEELPKLGITPATTRVIYNAMDVEGIQKLSLERIPDIPRAPYLLHASRYAKQKRHDLLFAAFAYLRKKHPTLKLVCLTKKVEPLLPLVAENGLHAEGPDAEVIFPGFQQNPYAWMAQAKGFVLCSDYEGLPGNLIQALICGCPAVSTNCPTGPSEIMTGPLSEWLVPCDDLEALSAKLEALLASPPTINPRQAADLVSPDKIAEQYVALALELKNHPSVF